jgi:hypothetical protein
VPGSCGRHFSMMDFEIRYSKNDDTR